MTLFQVFCWLFVIAFLIALNFSILRILRGFVNKLPDDK